MKMLSWFGLPLVLLISSTALAAYPPQYAPVHSRTPYDHYLAIQQGQVAQDYTPPHQLVSLNPAPVLGQPIAPNGAQPMIPNRLQPMPQEPIAPPMASNSSSSYYDIPQNESSAAAGNANYGDWHSGNYGSCTSPGGCADGNCYGGSLDLGACRTGHTWYGSVAGLIMNRDLPDRLVLTSEAGWPPARFLTNRDADVDWEGGFEVKFGQQVNNQVRWEVGYWMLGQFTGSATVLDPAASLVTPIVLNDVAVGPDLASDFFDLSSGHTVLRQNDVQNIELNMYYRPNWMGCGGCSGASNCSSWDVELLGGIRYFQFDEFLRFGGVEGGANFGDLGGRRELYMESDIENHLIGFQIGALIDYHLCRCWSLYAQPKIGLYGNHMRHRFNVRRGDNGAYGSNTLTGDTFPVVSTKNDVSFVSEIDLGVNWEYSQHWSAFAAYRAVAVTGIALADDQYPAYLADTAGIRDIDSSGSLILHGLVLGVQFKY